MARVSAQITPAEHEKIKNLIESCGLKATPEAIGTMAFGDRIRENTILGYQYVSNSALELEYVNSILQGIGDDKRPEHIIDTINQRSPSIFSNEHNFAPEVLNRISHIAADQYRQFSVGDTQPGNPDMWRLATLANSAKIAAGSYGPNDLGSIASRVIEGPYGLWETLRGKMGLPISGETSVAEAAKSSQLATHFFIPYEKQRHRDAFYAKHLVKEVDGQTDPAIRNTTRNVALAITPKINDEAKYLESFNRNEQALLEMNALDVANVERMLAKVTETENKAWNQGVTVDASGISVKDNDGLVVNQQRLKESLENQNGGLISWDSNDKAKVDRADYQKQLENYWKENPTIKQQIQAIQSGGKASDVKPAPVAAPPSPASQTQTTATRTPAATTTDPAPTPAKKAQAQQHAATAPAASAPATPTPTAPAASAPPPAAPTAAAPAPVSPEHQKALDGSMALFLSQLGITDETDRKLFAERFKDQAETIHTFEQRLRSFDSNGQTGSKVAEGQTLADGMAQHGGMLGNPQLLSAAQLAAVHNAYQQTLHSENIDKLIQDGQNRLGLDNNAPWQKDFTPEQNRLTKIDGRAPIGQTPRPNGIPQAGPGEGITYTGQTAPSPRGFVPAYKEPPLLAPTKTTQAATPAATNWKDGNHGFGDAGDRSWQDPSAVPTPRANSQPPARTAIAPPVTDAAPSTRGGAAPAAQKHSSLPGRGSGDNRQQRDPNEISYGRHPGLNGRVGWRIPLGLFSDGGENPS